MAYFDPQRQTKLKTDAGPQSIAATMKQYHPQAKRWRPVTYWSRALTDTETRYSQLEKEAKAVEWGVFANQIYLYGLRDTFDIDTDHKPVVPLFASHKITAPLRIERMRVRLQDFSYRLNYVAGKKAGAEVQSGKTLCADLLLIADCGLMSVQNTLEFCFLYVKIDIHQITDFSLGFNMICK